MSEYCPSNSGLVISIGGSLFIISGDTCMAGTVAPGQDGLSVFACEGPEVHSTH